MDDSPKDPRSPGCQDDNNSENYRHYGGRKMKILLFRFVISVVAFSGLVFSGLSYSADPICKGLTGAAFGQCQSAVAVGCDGTETQSKGCARIQENFEKIVGEEPPWKVGTCPCGSVEAYIDIIDADIKAGYNPFGEIRDFDLGYSMIFVGHDLVNTDPPRLELGTSLFFSFYPGSFELVGKQTCGFRNTSQANLDDLQAKHCVATILKAITDTEIKLFEPPPGK